MGGTVGTVGDRICTVEIEQAVELLLHKYKVR